MKSKMILKVTSSIVTSHFEGPKILSPSNGREEGETTLAGSKFTVAQVSCLCYRFNTVKMAWVAGAGARDAARLRVAGIHET